MSIFEFGIGLCGSKRIEILNFAGRGASGRSVAASWTHFARPKKTLEHLAMALHFCSPRTGDNDEFFLNWSNKFLDSNCVALTSD